MNTLIQHYEDVLLGKKKTLGKDEFYKTKTGNEKMAKECLKYFLEEIMRWTPEQSLELFSKKVYEKWGLDLILNRISLPPGINGAWNPASYVLAVYPELELSHGASIQKIYNGILAKTSRKELSTSLFSGPDGEQLLADCFQRAIDYTLAFETVEEYYNYFAEHDKEFVSRSALSKPLRVLGYDTALDFFHEHLPEEQQNDVAYYEAKAKQTRLQNKK